MSSFSASVQTNNGNLTVTRPLAADSAVDSLVDDMIYAVRNSDTLQAVSLSIVTADAPAAAAPDAPAAPADDQAAPPAAADPLAKTGK